jgi:signal transduction histidine kinase
MREAGAVRVAFETARLRLAEIRAEGEQARVSAYRSACQQSARTLDVARVSIWFLADDGEAIVCALSYDRDTRGFESGGQILRAGAERYFDAVRSRRVIVADDAKSDPQTDQLLAYLRKGSVGALLDAPIYRDGEVIGVVCHEHKGGPRHWTEREAGFASAVADLLTILVHQAERAELRAALEIQRELESEHRKMEALMRMGRVVLHDLGNVLTIAAMRAEELEREGGSEDAEEVKVSDVIDYSGKLLSQLRDFCERREPNLQVEAAVALSLLEPTLRNLLGKHIRFDFDCEVEETQLAMAPIEFEQLVLNLCMNAKDAVQDRGRVWLKATREGDLLTLEIGDDGCGMDEATQARLFEPFYSTKSGHTGVGLSAIYGIVDRAGGRVLVKSSVGEGTTFHLELPTRPSPAGFEQPWSF